MEISGIVNLATSMQAASTEQAIGIAVLKKAIDIQAAGAMALLEAIPAAPSANLPPHLGQNINITA
jgi:hypothetical protein